MKKLRILRQVLKRTGITKIMIIFIVFFFVAALVIELCEPGITSYGDALWYCYSVFSTVGFGDIVSVTTIGRIFSIILSLYSIIFIALTTGVIVAFFNELVKRRYQATRAEILDDVDRLPKLSKEELERLVEKIRNLKE